MTNSIKLAPADRDAEIKDAVKALVPEVPRCKGCGVELEPWSPTATAYLTEDRHQRHWKDVGEFNGVMCSMCEEHAPLGQVVIGRCEWWHIHKLEDELVSAGFEPIYRDGDTIHRPLQAICEKKGRLRACAVLEHLRPESARRMKMDEILSVRQYIEQRLFDLNTQEWENVISWGFLPTVREAFEGVEEKDEYAQVHIGDGIYLSRRCGEYTIWVNEEDHHEVPVQGEWDLLQARGAYYLPYPSVVLDK